MVKPFRRNAPAKNPHTPADVGGAGAVARSPQGGTRVREGLYQIQVPEINAEFDGMVPELLQGAYGKASNPICKAVWYVPPPDSYPPVSFEAQSNTADPTLGGANSRSRFLKKYRVEKA